jgi:GNAT superfamily N-acetyltransferase
MIELIPLRPDELLPFLEAAVPRYAAELVRSGNVPPEHALDVARGQFDELLPEGLHTPDQYLFTLWDPSAGKAAGTLWLGVRRVGHAPFAVLYDLFVDPGSRRQGYATQALEALEAVVQDLGFDTIRLRVFGHNRPARCLYRKLGYVETDVMMAKGVK